MTDRDEGAPLPPVEPEPPTTPVPAGDDAREPAPAGERAQEPGGVPPAAGVPPSAGVPPRSATTKPEVGRRAIAFIIDWVIAMVIYALLTPFSALLASLAGAAYILLRDGFDFEFMNGRSLGKRMMNLTVTRLNGAKMDLSASARRNWPLAIGMLPLGLLWLFLFPIVLVIGLYEVYNVLTAADGRRWGDRLAGTAVVETGVAVT